jgi:hypothetical protein
MANVSDTAGAAGHAGHDAHAGRPFMQHHFDTPTQQFNASKLGMWVFIATEILMFGGKKFVNSRNTFYRTVKIYNLSHCEYCFYTHFVYLCSINKQQDKR